MNNCKDCTQLLRFETTGIKEVPCDGFCLKAGKDKPERYIPVMLEHSCLNFQSKHKPLGPLCIKQSGNSFVSEKPVISFPVPGIVKPSVPDLREKAAGGNCVDCVNWRRKGFSVEGECWSGESINKGLVIPESHTCSCFHPHANINNAHLGDIIEIQVGEQWQLIFASTEHVVVRNRMGVEKPFTTKGLRFKKCQS